MTATQPQTDTSMSDTIPTNINGNSKTIQLPANIPKKPSKKRIRAHANPLSDDITAPISPAHIDWSQFYPKYCTAPQISSVDASSTSPIAPQSLAAAQVEELDQHRVTIADVGCGFGGLLVALAPHFPRRLILGLEIRERVVELVHERIVQLRVDSANAAAAAATADATPASLAAPTQSTDASPTAVVSSATTAAPLAPADYQNISVVKTNIMRYCVNYFTQHQLSKLFILFADPHFKRANHRRRVISLNFLALYAYVLRPGGRLYTVTDVEDLHNWQTQHVDAHPLFERLTDEEVKADICVDLMCNETEEGKKVTRLAGQKHVAVWRRVEDK